MTFKIKKNRKVKVKTKKYQLDKNNMIHVIGRCEYCKKRKKIIIKDSDVDYDSEDDKEIRKNKKIIKIK